jgi:molybdopterin-guanine dinucleotide biosynthesis protein A
VTPAAQPPSATSNLAAPNPAAPIAYILAGGGSTRFGQDKALAELGGQPMLLRMRDLLATVSDTINVIAPPEKYSALGIRGIPDLWPGEGPLGGIITALEHSQGNFPGREWQIILSCDMPFLNTEWLNFLAQRAAQSPAQVVLPQSTHGFEPLCACYRTNALASLRADFAADIRRVNAALQHLNREVLDEAVWKRFDNAGRLFWNMNAPADYADARRILNPEQS